MTSKLQLNARLNDFWVFPKLSKIYDMRSYNDRFFAFLDNPNLSMRMTQLYIHVLDAFIGSCYRLMACLNRVGG